jgi:hypothetical protein
MKIDTLPFNIAAIWIMTAVLFILYFNILKLFIVLLESLKLRSGRKLGGSFCRDKVTHLIPRPFLPGRREEKDTHD